MSRSSFSNTEFEVPNYSHTVMNATTGLMAIRELATINKVPINIHFDNYYIHVIVGFGTPYQEKGSYYLQDMYAYQYKRDCIYRDIAKMIGIVKPMIHPDKETTDV